MSDTLTQPTPRNAAEYKEDLAQMLAEMQRLNEQMRQDQQDIDRLKAEAAAYNSETQRLKAEGKLLDAEIRARLDSIRAMLDGLEGAA